MTWQIWSVADRPQFTLKDVRGMSNEQSTEGSFRPRLLEGPREFLRRVSFGFVHGRFAEALETIGCRVRSVERINDHPVWRITLARPWPDGDPQNRKFRNAIKRALRQVDPKKPVQDLEVMTMGDRLILLFLWETFTPPGVLAIQPKRADFLRQRDDGLWDRWQVQMQVCQASRVT